MAFFQKQKYFWRILSTIGIVSIVFQLITLSILAYFMVVPLGQRATDDLASVMIHGVETWETLPTNQRDVFKQRMKSKHDLIMTDNHLELAKSNSFLPYLYLLEQSLKKKLGQDFQVKQSLDDNGDEWYWLDFPISEGIMRYGFSRARIGVNPPVAFILLSTIGLLLTILTAVALTKRLTVPIERLHHAAQALGKGQWPEPVIIEGPEELTVLAREFNRMNLQVRELLTNRTTLLAGIAHDLRTPLTQIQLAFSMLPNNGGDDALMMSIQEDLDVINHLIGETLSISLELEEEKEVMTDIGLELSKIVTHLKEGQNRIILSQSESCCYLLHPLALRRIITNLLVNAVRYGANKPVLLNLSCCDDVVIIEVIDEGDGIPEDQLDAVFRPFYRLEKSRSSQTGGSGLGLAIVKQLVDVNNWNIQLQASSLGGTKAVLSIPCSPHHMKV